MITYVLDTNIASAIVKGDQNVSARFMERISDNLFLGCPMVWHELRRGLLAKDAKAQMTRFERFYSQFLWQDYEKADWALASDLWATRRVSGRPISDGDLLIAVFAINRSAILVTDNTKDFSGLHVSSENWR